MIKNIDKGYYGFMEINHGNKTFVTSVRDPLRSSNFIQYGDQWEDSTTGRMFDVMVKGVSETDARVTMEFFIAGLKRSGYKKNSNKQ